MRCDDVSPALPQIHIAHKGQPEEGSQSLILLHGTGSLIKLSQKLYLKSLEVNKIITEVGCCALTLLMTLGQLFNSSNP